MYQIGGIQSISTFPGDPTFNQFDNHYEVASYKRICDEFRVNSFSDFQFTHGKSNGLGNVYIGVSGHGLVKTGASYPWFNKFRDEGGQASKGNLLPVYLSIYPWCLHQTKPLV